MTRTRRPSPRGIPTPRKTGSRWRAKNSFSAPASLRRRPASIAIGPRSASGRQRGPVPELAHVLARIVDDSDLLAELEGGTYRRVVPRPRHCALRVRVARAGERDPGVLHGGHQGTRRVVAHERLPERVVDLVPEERELEGVRSPEQAAEHRRLP